MNSYNTIQAAYMLRKANVEALKELEDQLELNYITAHAITNADGSTPMKSWHIDDDAVFDTMMNDIGGALDEIGVGEAEKALRKAADDLIRYGLDLMPKCYAKERQTLENNCFGLNGCYVHLDIRERFIAATLKLDVTTVPLLSTARIRYGLR